MNMNEPLSKDGQGEEEQNNFKFDGKPGSYDSNSSSAQRKKSFSTTKPTEYNLPKEHLESSTSKSLETKAKNILLPWRKKHNKDSEDSAAPDTDLNLDTSPRSNVTSDVSPTHTDHKSNSGPTPTTTTHGYSYVKTTTTPAATHGQSKARTTPFTSHEHSNTDATAPTSHTSHTATHGHSNIKTTPPANREYSKVSSTAPTGTATHGHSNVKTTNPSTSYEHSKISSITPTGTTATHGHSNIKTTSSTTGQHSKASSTVPTAATHAHANVKTTNPVMQGHSNVSAGPKIAASTATATATYGHSNAETKPSSTNLGNHNVKDSSSATQGYSNLNSSADRDVIPGGFRDTTSVGVDPVDPSVHMNPSSKTNDNTETSTKTTIGAPQDTIKEIAEKVKMDQSQQTGLKNDRISGSDAIQGQTMDSGYKGAIGTASGLSTKEPPHYNDNMKNVQYPEKTRVEKQNISENAAERFKSERDDILHDDDYQQKNIKSKVDSNWGPIDYNTGAGTNKNLQDVVAPSSLKDNSFIAGSATQQKSEPNTKLGQIEYESGVSTQSGNPQDVYGSQTANRSAGIPSRSEEQKSGEPKNTNQSIVMPPTMKDEDLNKGYSKFDSAKPNEYGLDYLDDVEDYNEHDINDHSNMKDESSYLKNTQREGKPNYSHFEREGQIPGAFKADTFSNSMQRQDDDLLSPKQTTLQADSHGVGDARQGKYEFSNSSGNTKLTDLNKNNSGPTPSRSNFIDQIEPRRAKTTENISDAKNSHTAHLGTTGNVDAGTPGMKAKTFGSTSLDNSTETPGIAAFDDTGNTDSEHVKSGGIGATLFGSTKNANSTYTKPRYIADDTYAQEKQDDYGSGHSSSDQKSSSDDNIDISRNTKVLDDDAPGYKREVDMKNKRRTDIGGTGAANAYAEEVGNFPSLIDPHVPTYGFKDTNTSASQQQSLSSPSGAIDPENTSYSIHNEATSQGRKISVGSVGSGKSKHHHDHSHHQSRKNSSKGSDYDYNPNHSAEHTPRHHQYGSDDGEVEYEAEEQDEEKKGKQNFMGRVRNSISGGTFGFRSEI
ncbi:hbt1p [Saccharomyces arboricola H-6]|uniref:Hbt1p n=1 Tax=Saccharomyces arboricola (strain H-6 / AS 2.3317 / CBS 10644) TaxID=1160507 RepID=J8Q729_SACAR|nr:hbt1p [Saccharomyces arboricola H-6]